MSTRILATGIVSTVVMLAATSSARPQQRPAPCAGAPHRQFDFWLGDWDVFTLDGKAAGRNHITAIAGGCGLEEQWTGAGGGSGRSLNAYDGGDRRWHQFWVGGDGTVLRLSGRFTGNVMTLGDAANRIRFTSNADGTVRQLWEQSGDGGKTWKTVFDGKYVRRGQR